MKPVPETARAAHSPLTAQRVRSAWLFLAPMLLVLAAVAGWPLLRTVYFSFTDASLAHETACTLRDIGDLPGAEREFRRSVRTRQAENFGRTHAVTLGYLADVQAKTGAVDEACATWTIALDSMDGITSARTRKVVTDMRASLSPFRGRGIPAAAELDARAHDYLAAAR